LFQLLYFIKKSLFIREQYVCLEIELKEQKCLLEKEKGEHDFDLNSLNCKIEEIERSKEELELKLMQEIEKLNSELKKNCELMSRERNSFQIEISKLKEDNENYVRELSVKLEMNKFNGEKLLIESHESVVRHLNEKLFAGEERMNEQSQLIENLQYEISNYQAKFGELHETVNYLTINIGNCSLIHLENNILVTRSK